MRLLLSALLPLVVAFGLAGTALGDDPPDAAQTGEPREPAYDRQRHDGPRGRDHDGRRHDGRRRGWQRDRRHGRFGHGHPGIGVVPGPVLGLDAGPGVVAPPFTLPSPPRGEGWVRGFGGGYGLAPYGYGYPGYDCGLYFHFAPLFGGWGWGHGFGYGYGFATGPAYYGGAYYGIYEALSHAGPPIRLPADFDPIHGGYVVDVFRGGSVQRLYYPAGGTHVIPGGAPYVVDSVPDSVPTAPAPSFGAAGPEMPPAAPLDGPALVPPEGAAPDSGVVAPPSAPADAYPRVPRLYGPGLVPPR